MGNDAPERIWTSEAKPGRGYWQDHGDGMYRPVEYVRADLCAAQPAEAGRVSVKPLVWNEGLWSGQPAWFADCGFGCWTLVKHRVHDNRISVDDLRGELHEEDYATFDEAKAAAQADYERRILAALTVAPAAQEPVAWRLSAQGLAAKFTDSILYAEMMMDRDRGWEVTPLYATPPAAPTDMALVEVLNRCLRVFEHHGVGGHLTGEIKQILAALASRAAPPRTKGGRP